MNTRRKLLAGLGAAGAVALATKAQAAERQAPSLPDQNYFPNCELTTHEGERVKFYDDLIRGKLVIVNFMYAHCQGACPANTATLRQVQKLLGDRVGKDIFINSITLQPELDTPEALKEYAQQHGVEGNGWKFLTGTREDIDLVRRKLGFWDPDPEVDGAVEIHTTMVRMGNDAYRRWIMTPVAYAHSVVSSLMHLDRNHRGRVDLRPLSPKSSVA